MREDGAEREERSEDAAGTPGARDLDAERPGAREAGAGADRRRPRGRRGARRVVAPATSGRPESEEARRFRSASADGEVPADGADEGSQQASRPSTRRVARPAEGTERLSPRDRWILQERPPHW